MRIKLEDIYKDYFKLNEHEFKLLHGLQNYYKISKAIPIFEASQKSIFQPARVSQLLDVSYNTAKSHYEVYLKVKNELDNR